MQSKATTVDQYLRELPAERAAAIAAVRDVILRNLDRDYEEGMSYGMIGYAVPHRVFPAGYHCNPAQPLPFAGLASQKGHMSVYLMSAYGDKAEETWLRQRFAKAGKKLDMGRCCIRFKRLEDLPLEVIGEAIRRVPAKAYVERYIKVLEGMGKWPPRGGAAASKAGAAKAGAAKAGAGGLGAAKPGTRASERGSRTSAKTVGTSARRAAPKSSTRTAPKTAGASTRGAARASSGAGRSAKAVARKPARARSSGTQR